MVGEAAALRGHDGAAVGPRPGRPRRRGVGDELRAALGREDVVVQPVALVDPGPLLVEGGPVGVTGAGAEARGRERDLRGAPGVGDHVVVELDVPEVRVAPVQEGLTAVVDHHGRVDLAVLHERVAEGVAERAGRAVRDAHADGHPAGGPVDDGDVPVELAAALDGLARPSVLAGPAEGADVHGGAVVGPVHHVGGRPDAPLLHGEVGGAVLVVSCVEVHPPVVHQRCRVGGVDVLHDRVVGLGGHRCRDRVHRGRTAAATSARPSSAADRALGRLNAEEVIVVSLAVVEPGRRGRTAPGAPAVRRPRRSATARRRSRCPGSRTRWTRPPRRTRCSRRCSRSPCRCHRCGTRSRSR